MMNLPGHALWFLPGKFRLAKLLGPKYSLRCVLFHHIADKQSPFTHGLGVTMSPDDFEARIRFISRYYTPVDLDTILAAAKGRELPPRAVLVTFDDAYASVAEVAAPICAKYRVPACFFVNGAFLGNVDISLDNLLCYVANTVGLRPINALARELNGPDQKELHSRIQITQEFIPTLSRERRVAFKARLAETIGFRTEDLARDAGLYISPEQVRELACSGFEIGNHTYSHVHCRILSGSDYSSEVDQNRATLEKASGRSVRVFSVPYGSVADFTPDLEAHLRKAAYDAAFLVESRTNTRATNLYHLNRVSVHASSDAGTFAEIEVIPRLRAIRDSLLGERKPHSTGYVSSLPF